MGVTGALLTRRTSLQTTVVEYIQSMSNGRVSTSLDAETRRTRTRTSRARGQHGRAVGGTRTSSTSCGRVRRLARRERTDLTNQCSSLDAEPVGITQLAEKYPRGGVNSHPLRAGDGTQFVLYRKVADEGRARREQPGTPLAMVSGGTMAVEGVSSRGY